MHPEFIGQSQSLSLCVQSLFDIISSVFDIIFNRAYYVVPIETARARVDFEISPLAL